MSILYPFSVEDTGDTRPHQTSLACQHLPGMSATLADMARPHWHVSTVEFMCSGLEHCLTLYTNGCQQQIPAKYYKNRTDKTKTTLAHYLVGLNSTL